jgi:hypothetical protein
MAASGCGPSPHPSGDPNKCLFDMWYLTQFPEGVTEYWSNSMRDWVSVDHQVEHQTGIAGEVSCGPGIDQDVAIWTTQHKGCIARASGASTAVAGAAHPLLPRHPRSLSRLGPWMADLGVSDGDQHELGDLSPISPTARCGVFEDVGDYGIVVCRVKGELFALEDNCSTPTRR